MSVPMMVVLIVIIVAIVFCYYVRLVARTEREKRIENAAHEQNLKYIENEGMINRARVEELGVEKAQIEKERAAIQAQAMTEQLRLVSGGKPSKMKEAVRSVADTFRADPRETSPNRLAGGRDQGDEGPGAEGIVEEASPAPMIDDWATMMLSKINELDARNHEQRVWNEYLKCQADTWPKPGAVFADHVSASYMGQPTYYAGGDYGYYGATRRASVEMGRHCTHCGTIYIYNCPKCTKRY